MAEKVDFNSKEFKEEHKKLNKSKKISGKEKTINVDFSMAKIGSLASKGWIKFLVALGIFFVVSGIIGNVYFITVNIILYLKLIGALISVWFFGPYLIKMFKSIFNFFSRVRKSIKNKISDIKYGKTSRK